MQPDHTRCTECGGEMEPGFLVDHTENGILQQRWAKGAPQKRWWGGLKVNRDDVRRVETARCKVCGFLKSYAN